MKHSSPPAPWHDFMNDMLCRFPIMVSCDDKRDGTHRHRQFGLELNLTRQGQGGIEVDQKQFPVGPNTLVIIPDKLPHQTTTDTPGRYTRSVLCIAPFVLQSAAPASSRSISSANRHAETQTDVLKPYSAALQSLVAHPVFTTPKSIQLSEQEVASLHVLWQRISWETHLQSSWWQQTIATLALESLLWVARLVERGSSGPGRHAAARVISENAKLAHDVATHIRHHVADNFSAESLAEYFNVSREHLSRTMKRHHGVSLHRYMMAQRIAAARRMLIQQPTMPVMEVAVACGFQSHAHFSRVFKQTQHMTPAACRAMQSGT